MFLIVLCVGKRKLPASSGISLNNLQEENSTVFARPCRSRYRRIPRAYRHTLYTNHWLPGPTNDRIL